MLVYPRQFLFLCCQKIQYHHSLQNTSLSRILIKRLEWQSLNGNIFQIYMYLLSSKFGKIKSKNQTGTLEEVEFCFRWKFYMSVLLRRIIQMFQLNVEQRGLSQDY